MDARGGRPLLLVDLAVPRDIDPACAGVSGVTLMDMDALQASVERHLTVRRGEAVQAEAIIEDEIQRFASWLGHLDVLPTLTALRERGDEVVAAELARNAGRWESASEADLERIERVARSVVNRLLHEPTRRVKDLDDEHRHARLALLRELFGLEDEAAASSDEAAEVRRLHG
jgi:glutamyl-tRNA reductase